MRELIVITALFFTLQLFGQKYTSEWYNNANGLPQNSVKDIVKDKFGFLWLSTEDGIVRYDGLDFITYKDPHLSNFNFWNFSGNVNDDNIYAYNLQEQQQVTINKRRITVQTPSPEDLNKLGVHRKYDKNDYLLVNKNTVFERSLSRFFIRVSSGVYFIDLKKQTIYLGNKTSQPKIIPVSIDNINDVFVHNNFLFVRDPKNKRVVKIENGNLTTVTANDLIFSPHIKIYWQQLSGQIILINRNTIYTIKYINGTLQSTLLCRLQDTDWPAVSSIYYDEQFKKIYLGTVNKGLRTINLVPFYTPRNSSFTNEIYYTALPFGYHTIINTQGRVYNQHHLVQDLHFSDSKDSYTMISDDSHNFIYVNNNKVYTRYFATNYQTASVRKFGSKVTAVYKDQNKYALTFYNGSSYSLNLYHDSSFQKLYFSIVLSKSINCIRFFSSDQILVGCSDGLYLISISRKTIQKIKSVLLDIKNITSTTDGSFWIISRGKGFYLLKNLQLIKMPDDPQKYLSSLHTILEDQYGYLWIPTNNGLFKVLKRSLTEYAKDRSGKVYYYRYTQNDGFYTNEFNGTGSSSNTVTLKDGNIVLPSMEGYVFFNPSAIPSYYPKAKDFYIERAVLKNSKLVQFKDRLSLDNNFGRAEILIDIPYFANNENLYIEAALQSNSKGMNWDVVKNRKYSIDNLKPGAYTLNIRVLISPTGIFAYKKIGISIHPAFYQTIWFKALITLLCVALIIFFVAVRTKLLTTKNSQLKRIVHHKNNELKTTHNKMRDEEEYQKKLIQTINHDISTPVKYLSIMLRHLPEIDDPKMQKEVFTRLSKSSDELYKFTQNLKNYSELFLIHSEKHQEKYFNINDILEEKKRLFEEIAWQKNSFILNATQGNIKTNINETIISAIIHNVLDNSVKNTADGKVHLCAEESADIITIIISDTGSGIKESLAEYYNALSKDDGNSKYFLKPYGMGLYLVIYLLKKIDGQLYIKTNKSHGTEVVITLKK